MGRLIIPGLFSGLGGFLMAACSLNSRYQTQGEIINGEVTLRIQGTCPPNLDTTDRFQEEIANLCSYSGKWVGSMEPGTLQCINGYYQAVLRGRCVSREE